MDMNDLDICFLSQRFFFDFRYSLLSSLSTLKSTDMVPQLPTVVNYMLESLRSTEGVKVHYTEEESAASGVLAQFEVDDTNAEDDDDEDYG